MSTAYMNARCRKILDLLLRNDDYMPLQQLAAETGNAEATAKLRKVVDIDDAETGTVRLKRGVAKADEMALDTASTKTTRIRG